MLSVEPVLRYILPASAFAIASLQPSLMSAVCSFMQSAIAPLPVLTSAQNFLTSALQALPTAAARTIATWQSAERSESGAARTQPVSSIVADAGGRYDPALAYGTKEAGAVN